MMQEISNPHVCAYLYVYLYVCIFNIYTGKIPQIKYQTSCSRLKPDFGSNFFSLLVCLLAIIDKRNEKRV